MFLGILENTLNLMAPQALTIPPQPPPPPGKKNATQFQGCKETRYIWSIWTLVEKLLDYSTVLVLQIKMTWLVHMCERLKFIFLKSKQFLCPKFFFLINLRETKYFEMCFL